MPVVNKAMYRPAGYDDSDEDEIGVYGYMSDYEPSKNNANCSETMNYLLPLYPAPTEDNETLLYNAVLDDNLDETKRILKLDEHLRSGACLRMGWPILFHACYEAKLAIVEYLVLEERMDVNRTYNLQTALMMAASSPQTTELVYPVVRLLLECGAIIGVLDRFGWSPIMFACKQGHLEVVKEIIGESSMLSVDNEGNTALIHAVNNNHYEIVRVLLRAGAQTHIVNREGYTPRQCALNRNYMDIADLLPTEEDYYDLPAKYMTYTNYRNFIYDEQGQTHPDYFPELGVMLFGMSSEKHLRFFAQANVNLSEFLIVNDDRLREIGIKYPIERKRILLGLYDFHRQPWSKKSLWTIPKQRDLDCYDIQEALGNLLRQLTVIHGSLLYTKLLTASHDPDVFWNVLRTSNLPRQLEKFRSMVRMLETRMSEIHEISSPKPVFHIPNQDTKQRSTYKVFNIGVCLIIGSFAIYWKMKK